MALEEIRNERLKKLALLREAGVDPYPIDSRRTHTLSSVVESFEALVEKAEVVVLAGRVMAVRGHGALLFADFSDASGASLQAYCKEDEMTPDNWKLLGDTLDIGDFAEFTGALTLTKRGEKSILVKSWRMLAKSLLPLPDKWNGLQDVEERFRKRYLDTLMSPEVRARFVARAQIISAIRSFLDKDGFLEVDTPVLQSQAGGATAQPFKTHHNALDMDMYLRISDELYLKRLLIGGFSKVYEIARDFRNEGIDVTHNPEFTMIEWYEAYSNAEKERARVTALFREVVQTVFGKLAISHDGVEIDFERPFSVISYGDLLRKYALLSDPDTISMDDLKLKAKQMGATVGEKDGRYKIIDHIYKKTCRPKLVQPTFIIDYPIDYLPLAKKIPGKTGIVDAFQLVVGGYELVKAFSELNDPLDQRERFKKEDVAKKAGDTEAQETDEDFIEAMEYGMPPAGGVGIGIDRLVMLLTDTKNIREVILFPTLRPKT